MRLQELGCLACRREGRFHIPPELHHPTEGGRRIDDDAVIPLCRWHHQGTVPRDCANTTEATMVYGPSFAVSKRLFTKRYGTQRELLAQTERLMEVYA
jgi:hypothetical protein